MLGCSLTNLDLAAQIRWLPKREEILEHSPEQIPSGLDSDAFGHPVLIVTKGLDEKGRVSVLLMTSFDNRDILKKFPGRDQRRNREPYWPIKPTPAHPDTPGKLFELKDNRLMDKEYSYVNSQSSYSICYDILEPYKPEYPEDIWALEEKSFEKLTGGRDYEKFHSKAWRTGREETPPPPLEPVKEMEQEANQTSKARDAGTFNLTVAIRSKAWREYYEEIKDFLPFDDYKSCFWDDAFLVDNPDP
ncbi:hypothetical protein QBC32DRAFT_374232 [Pseudoneurospora amorphoporcata]|uniref:Uncharacterized protein n=1 Tax=Pseudoneurospora amorphoporcata TaxID=241081 RepID=A0AAN6NL12_9PEZI|nr:hypothetical protein QBC32DRAFT_374232 [Pseudoneurospora amorphoporcata]